MSTTQEVHTEFCNTSLYQKSAINMGCTNSCPKK